MRSERALLAVLSTAALVYSLLDVRLMVRRPVWTTNAVAFFVGVGQFVGFITLPLYVQEPHGLAASPVGSGVYLLPMTVAIVLSGLAAGRLERRFAARTLLIASALPILGAFVLLPCAREALGDLHGVDPAWAR